MLEFFMFCSPLHSHFSRFGMQKDSPVLAVELDIDEMARNHKA